MVLLRPRTRHARSRARSHAPNTQSLKPPARAPQPPAWTSYFTDLHAAVLLMPAGLIGCFLPLTDAALFLVLYGVTAVYFSGVMVRAALCVCAVRACVRVLCAVRVLCCAA